MDTRVGKTPSIDAAYLHEFVGIVDQAAERLRRISDADAARKPAPGKWSRKEIIGHLIDSAANNHVRFVRAQFLDGLVFAGYEQDKWVAIVNYQSRPWQELVALWQLYNHHIAHIMATADPSAVDRPQTSHNFDDIAFKPVPRDQPSTLGYFMRDYVDHLEHHLRQIL